MDVNDNGLPVAVQAGPGDAGEDLGGVHTMNRCYLVDLENVGGTWRSAVRDVGPGDRVLLFFTKNCNNIEIGSLFEVAESGCDLGYVRCNTGKNGLDFQLCSELGYMAAKEPGTRFVIVSNDGGYDVLVEYWARRGVSVCRHKSRAPQAKAAKAATTVRPRPVKPEAPVSVNEDGDSRTAVKHKWSEMLAGAFAACSATERERKHFPGCIMASMDLDARERMTKIYRDTVRIFGQERALEMYRVLKPSIRRILDNGPYPPPRNAKGE